MRSEPTQDEIQRVLGRLHIHRTVNEASGEHVIADCPACGKEKHLYANTETGNWDCKKCQASGGLFSLATALGIKLREKKLIRSAAGVLVTNSSLGKVEHVPMDKIEAAHSKLWNAEHVEGSTVRMYTEARGFTEQTVRRFKLGCMKMTDGQLALGIPYLSGNKCALIKMRNLETEKEKRTFNRYPKGAPSGMFNADGVRDCKQAVLVEGEIDAISMWQMGITNVASTSLGAKKDLPAEYLDTLSNADDIVLFYDADAAGSEATQSLMQRMGSHRCRIASIPEDIAAEAAKVLGRPPKDANDLLVAGTSKEAVKRIIDGAKGTTNPNVVGVGFYSEAIENEIMKGETSLGLTTGYVGLDKCVRGWRLGEVTVVTGHTGQGKSTWLTEVMDKISATGSPVLCSALENGPVTVARKAFQRRYGFPISTIKSEDERSKAMDVLADLANVPIYVLDLYGLQKFDLIADSIRYAAKRLGVKYVMLDHVHYVSKDNDRQDEREHYDVLMKKIVMLSRELHIHIWLVVHPRGSVERTELPGGESLKGSSAWKQDTDNGITVYRSVDAFGDNTVRNMHLKDPEGRKIEVKMAGTTVMLCVWKARHDDAREGACMLEFNPRTLHYSEKDKDQEQDQPSKQPTAQAVPDRTAPRENPWEGE